MIDITYFYENSALCKAVKNSIFTSLFFSHDRFLRRGARLKRKSSSSSADWLSTFINCFSKSSCPWRFLILADPCGSEGTWSAEVDGISEDTTGGSDSVSEDSVARTAGVEMELGDTSVRLRVKVSVGEPGDDDWAARGDEVTGGLEDLYSRGGDILEEVTLSLTWGSKKLIMEKYLHVVFCFAPAPLFFSLMVFLSLIYLSLRFFHRFLHSSSK